MNLGCSGQRSITLQVKSEPMPSLRNSRHKWFNDDPLVVHEKCGYCGAEAAA